MKTIKNTKPKVRFPEFKDDWEYKRFENFLIYTPRPKAKPKRNYLSIGLRSHFKGTFQKPDTDPNKNAMDKLYEIKENDFLLNITFAWEGALAIVPKDDDGGFVSHRFPTYTIANEVDKMFFKYHFFKEKSKHQLGIVSPGGAGRNRVLNKKDFLKIKLLFPSLPEQKKIAHFFTTLDTKIKQLEEKKSALEEYKKGLMQKLFSQEIRFKDEEGNDYPDWEEKRLGEVTSYTKGFAFKSSNYVKNGIRIIRVSDLGSDKIKKDNKMVFIKSINSEKLHKYILNKGDIIITTVGSDPYLLESSVGRGIYVSENNLGLLNQNLLKFNANTKFNNEFIFGFINSHKYFNYINSIKRGNANQSNITVVDLLKYKIKIPIIEEQQKIANFLSRIDSKINNVSEQIESTKEYKKGLLQRMFVN